MDGHANHKLRILISIPTVIFLVIGSYFLLSATAFADGLFENRGGGDSLQIEGAGSTITYEEKIAGLSEEVKKARGFTEPDFPLQEATLREQVQSFVPVWVDEPITGGYAQNENRDSIVLSEVDEDQDGNFEERILGVLNDTGEIEFTIRQLDLDDDGIIDESDVFDGDVLGDGDTGANTLPDVPHFQVDDKFFENEPSDSYLNNMNDRVTVFDPETGDATLNMNMHDLHQDREGYDLVLIGEPGFDQTRGVRQDYQLSLLNDDSRLVQVVPQGDIENGLTGDMTSVLQIDENDDGDFERWDIYKKDKYLPVVPDYSGGSYNGEYIPTHEQSQISDLGLQDYSIFFQDNGTTDLHQFVYIEAEEYPVGINIFQAVEINLDAIRTGNLDLLVPDREPDEVLTMFPNPNDTLPWEIGQSRT